MSTYVSQAAVKRSLIAVVVLLCCASEAQATVQRIRFFLTPDLVAGMSAATLGTNLSQYVHDLNYVFAKQTIRQFTFNSSTDILITAALPTAQSLESQDEIWITWGLSDYVAGDGQRYSYGGYAGLYASRLGGFVQGMRLDKIHDPLNMVPGYDTDNYLRQLETLVHEIEHIFGAGIGEYYSLYSILDTTGIEPRQDLNYDAGYPGITDPYWLRRPDYYKDPLLVFAYRNPRAGSPLDRQAVLETLWFADVTVAVVNLTLASKPAFDYSSSLMPELARSKVQVQDSRTGVLLSGATVKVWKVKSDPLNTAVLLSEGISDGNGQMVFEWACPFLCMDSFNNKLLIKAYHPDYEPAAIWYSAFDAMEAKWVDGRSEVIIDTLMTRISDVSGADTVAPEVSITSPSTDQVFLSGTTFNMSAIVTDDGSVASVTYLVNGVLACARTSAPYVCGWSIPPAGIPVNNVLEVRAVDAAGNIGSRSVAFKVDSLPPSLVAFSPSGSVYVKVGAQLTVSMSASDDAGVYSLRITIDGATFCGVEGVSSLSCSWTGATSSGLHNVRYTIVDLVGRTTSGEAIVVVDGIPPAVVMTAPLLVRRNRTFTVGATATDMYGVASVDFYRGSSRICADSTAPYSCSMTAPYITGRYVISVRAYDRAGNVAAKSRTLTVLR